MKAFPKSNNVFPEMNYREEHEEGMDLRDYFAAKAMQAIINGMATRDALCDGKPYNFFWNEVMNDNRKSDRSTISENAYEIADAMMEARND